MRRYLLGLLVASSAALVAPGPALAVPCHLVTDAAGDVRLGDGDVDVLSADVSVDATTLRVVLRMASVSDLSLLSATGSYVRLSFGIAGRRDAVSVYTMAGERTYAYWAGMHGAPAYGDATLSGAWGTADPSAAEYRIAVPLADLAALVSIPAGTVLSGVGVDTWATVGPRGEWVAVGRDGASGGDYIAGDVNCAS